MLHLNLSLCRADEEEDILQPLRDAYRERHGRDMPSGE